MFALKQPSYMVRPADASEASVIVYLRMASLLCLEMPKAPLDVIHAIMDVLPDVDAELVGSARYLVAERNGELIGGAGWSVLPLSYPAGSLLDDSGRPADLSLDPGSVLIRGMFLDPDQGRSGAGAGLLARIEAEASQLGYDCAEIIVPAVSEGYYRSLGFRRRRGQALRLGSGKVLPLLQMRRCFGLRLAAAA